MSTLENLLRQERLFTLAGLAVITGLAWIWLVPMAQQMSAMLPADASAPDDAPWSSSYFWMVFCMWAAMMIGMMLPSATPVLLLYVSALRHSAHSRLALPGAYGMMLGYLLAWTAFSLLATTVQWQLSQRALLSYDMAIARSDLAAGLLIAAGLYQFSTLKQTCLSHCRSGLEFLQRYWRPGLAGALRMGMRHGLYCVGCCGALMLLLFFAGMMNLLWIAGLSALVLGEKLLPWGARSTRLSGGLLVLSGIVMLSATF